jgi:HD-like signal output (HDOD) protein
MIRWFLSLFGIKNKAQVTAQPRSVSPGPTRRPTPPRSQTETKPTPSVGGEAKEFLVRLVSDDEPADLQELPPDDRVFLSGLLKRIRENQLTIPLLPQAAIEISRLMGNPNSHIDDFVRVLESDPALSVDVLRIANSAFYGFSSSTQSVHQAVVRIGLTQIRGLIIVAHLQGRVLHGGVFQAEARQLSSLSMTLAQLGQDLSDCLHMERDTAFTRGVLSHVEHFIIMGTVAEISADHQRKINPTTQGLLEAFRRFGPRVRELAANAWGLGDLMLDAGSQSAMRGGYAPLAKALVAHWTGAQVPVAMEGLDPDRVAVALRRFPLPEATSGDTR